jgi:hypothetical protein
MVVCGTRVGAASWRQGRGVTVQELLLVRPRTAVLAAVIAGFVALLVFAGSGGAAGTPSGAVAGGGKAAPATSQAVKAAPTHAVNSRPVVRSVASRLAAERGALLRHANFKTLAGVRAYLRAIGVNPRGVVIQRGLRNYAGSNCPGGGWTCASTAHAVVQIARAGGKNRFTCARVHCAVVQAAFARAATNTAKCNKTTGLIQDCSITQGPSGDNVAIVVERAKQASSNDPIQNVSATVSAAITQQTGGSFNNQACVYQEITETVAPTNGKKGVEINTTLQAHQSVSISQDAAAGSNTVQGATAPPASIACAAGPLTQTQSVASRATGTAKITQNQNAANSDANVSLDIEQNQGSGFGVASGPNTAKFNQTSTLTAVAHTPTGGVSQTQSSPTGGILATINQDSTGVNTAIANQAEYQCEDAFKDSATTPTCSETPDSPGFASLTQTQYGPIGHGGAPGRARPGRSLALVKKGDGTSAQTGGNAGSTFTVNQSTKQFSDAGSTQTNDVQGDCQTSGNCTVTQSTNVNGTTSSNTESGQSVNTQTTCSGSTCTSTGPTTTGTLTTLTNGFSVSNADIKEFGTGGMRGSGSGSITVSGISGAVLHAFLYWHGPTNSGDPASNANVTFNGNSVTGTNIGTASDNCWSFQNSQSYRADVTSLVTGDGSYSLSNFLKADADINGVSLIVFYDDSNSANDRNIVLWNGNDSNIAFGSDPAGWDETISDVPYPGSGSASLDFVVADGQSFSDADLVVNGTTVASGGAIFQGDSGPNYSGNPSGVTGSLWDVKPFDITSLLTSGSNNVHVTMSGLGEDCISLVVAAANVPASAPVIP